MVTSEFGLMVTSFSGKTETGGNHGRNARNHLTGLEKFSDAG
jgi:hypothetical protein